MMQYNTLHKWLETMLLAICLTLSVVIFHINKFSESKYVSDAESYVAMAGGHSEEVRLHHARRIFYPWLVNKLGYFTGMDTAFFSIGTMSLFVFLLLILLILRFRIKQSFIVSVILIFLPYLFLIYQELYLPTLFFISLSSIYYFLLIYKRYLLSIFLLLLLLLTRDEALIILFSFISALLIDIFKGARKKSYYLYIIFSGIILLASWVIIGYKTKANINMHDVSHIFFILSRIPLFAMRNLTGFAHWVDTYKNLPFYTHQPWIVFNAPQWLQRISIIKQIGIYDWDFRNVMDTALIALSIFATAPTILLYLIKEKYLKIIKNSIAFNTILLSGCIIFVLSPCMGPPSYRYYVNAWPLFFLITALLLKSVYMTEIKIYRKIIISYILSAWLPVLLSITPNFIPMVIISEIVLHYYTWIVLSLIPKKKDSMLSLEVGL